MTFNTYCSSTETMVIGTRLIVFLYVRTLALLFLLIPVAVKYGAFS